MCVFGVGEVGLSISRINDEPLRRLFRVACRRFSLTGVRIDLSRADADDLLISADRFSEMGPVGDR